MGVAIGLDAAALKTALENNLYADEVQADIAMAQQIGVRGVPFFVFDRKYAVSGAQDSRMFLQALEQSYGEWKAEHTDTALQIQEGQVCTPDEGCL